MSLKLADDQWRSTFQHGFELLNIEIDLVSEEDNHEPLSTPQKMSIMR